MSKLLSNYELMTKLMNQGIDAGVIQLKAKGEIYDGRSVEVNGKTLIHFGNCSYLGLDTAPEIKQGIIDTVTKYGSSFSSSRACIEIGLYEELEVLLEEIIGYPCLVSQTTSLGHQSVFPVLITAEDAIIVDHQVHSSVLNAVKQVQAQGTKVEMIRHNNVEALEDKIKELKDKHRIVWYMGDGIYSMYGDGAPIDDLRILLDKYEQLHCYIDDAHGMSWAGENGKGFVLNFGELHPKMIFSMSMAKGFGTFGGILVFPTRELKNAIRTFGASLIFSGPIPTPSLGASIASAHLHLNGEVTRRQNALYERIRFFRAKADAYKVPIINKTFSPIFYVGLGSFDAAVGIAKDLIHSGFYTNCCSYPSVPYKYSGIRVAITVHHTFEDIEKLVQTIAFMVNEYEAQGIINREKIEKTFKVVLA